MIQIGIMGPGKSATQEDKDLALELGKIVAQNGWALLTGGMASGVMDAASRGYKQEGGTCCIGILSSKGERASEYLDIAIITGMGSARNQINAMSCDYFVAIGNLESHGTRSEVDLRLAHIMSADYTKTKKSRCICLGPGGNIVSTFQRLFSGAFTTTDTPKGVEELIRRGLLGS